jgi:hypothetical protein
MGMGLYQNKFLLMSDCFLSVANFKKDPFKKMLEKNRNKTWFMYG